MLDKVIILCYNGDITSLQSYEALLNAIPQTNHLMIGRGILRNPALIAQLKEHEYGELCSKSVQSSLYTKETLKAFHDEIFEGYAAQTPGETPTLFKMKDLWTYLSESFAAPDKHLKKIRKASNYTEYHIAVNHLFRECELCPAPSSP